MEPTKQRGRAAEGDEDVEGHSLARRDGEDFRSRTTEEDDVEGHSMLQNPMLSRSAAQNREREIQRNLKQHDLKTEARRPFFKRDR